MTVAKRHAPLRGAIPAAALAALLLAGCSSGHVGESWQCPIAEGGSCESVAAADPAVPERDAAGGMALGEPLYRPWPEDAREAPPDSGSCDAGCGFDPLGWLARLFGFEDPGSGLEGGDGPGAGASGEEGSPAGRRGACNRLPRR